MQRLQILGMGCAKCLKLAEQAEAAAKELGLDYEMEKVTNINDIMAFGVIITPALAVNGEVKAAGKIPSMDEMKTLIA